MVGFDADRSDIFDKQYEFAMSLPIPIFIIRAVVAPFQTPLYKGCVNRTDNRDWHRILWKHLWNQYHSSKHVAWNTGRGVKYLVNKLYTQMLSQDTVVSWHIQKWSSVYRDELKKISECKMRMIERDANDILQNHFSSLVQARRNCFKDFKGILLKYEVFNAWKAILSGFLMAYMQHRYLYKKQKIWKDTQNLTPEPVTA